LALTKPRVDSRGGGGGGGGAQTRTREQSEGNFT